MVYSLARRIREQDQETMIFYESVTFGVFVPTKTPLLGDLLGTGKSPCAS